MRVVRSRNAVCAARKKFEQRCVNLKLRSCGTCELVPREVGKTAIAPVLEPSLTRVLPLPGGIMLVRLHLGVKVSRLAKKRQEHFVSLDAPQRPLYARNQTMQIPVVATIRALRVVIPRRCAGV